MGKAKVNGKLKKSDRESHAEVIPEDVDQDESEQKDASKNTESNTLVEDSDSSVYSELSEDDENSEEEDDSEEEESEDENLTDDDDDHGSFLEDDFNEVNDEDVEVPKDISKKFDEYAENDSSDEEDIRNTIGNIPVKWYDEFEHIGYDLDGKKIIKPIRGDQLDDFLKKMDDPNYWRTVKDEMTGQDVVLTDQDIDVIQRIQRGQYPDGSYDPYEPWIDYFSGEKMIHPVTSHPSSKRSFIPSKIEKNMVSKMVHAIKMGYIKPRKKPDSTNQFYMLWDKEDADGKINKRMLNHMPAPKLKLPGHEESYNPPPEYLFSKQEEEDWKSQDPEDRKLEFIPQKFSSLRACPAYSNFIRERFERCLDLYLCPRQRKMRVQVDPEDLIPKLPKPRDLQPFPTTLSLKYTGHTDLVRSISVECSGQFLASGSDDGTVRIWEVSTGRCLKTFKLESPVKCVAWCPNVNACVLAASFDKMTVILNAGVGDKLIISNTDSVLNAEPAETSADDAKKVAVQWREPSAEEYNKGIRIVIDHPKEVKTVTWHIKGDYFATLMPDGAAQSVTIHQLSKKRSQMPFSKSKGMVQSVLFHPSRPYLFVATQKYVRVYNLMKQVLAKKLLANCKWISSMAVHPQGDNLIIGSYDSRLSWFDLDLSTKPYKTLRHHKKAIRQVAYHKRYPLFASASDDCSIVVSHGMVYNDLLQNPLIVPVKILRGHKSTQDLGILDCIFHPTQPWLFSSGSDHNIHLYT